MTKIKVGIFDDHPIVSNGLKSFLTDYTEELDIILSATTEEELTQKIPTQTPEIMLVDVVVPDTNSLDLFNKLIKENPKLKIIAYTTLKSPILVENLLGIGVKGFVNKTQPPHELYNAIVAVHNEMISVPKKYEYLTSKYRIPENSTLTKREFEIIQLIANEATTVEIASKLSLSIKTVENHRLSIFRKLGVKNAAGLILIATRMGYIN